MICDVFILIFNGKLNLIFKESCAYVKHPKYHIEKEGLYLFMSRQFQIHTSPQKGNEIKRIVMVKLVRGAELLKQN